MKALCFRGFEQGFTVHGVEGDSTHNSSVFIVNTLVPLRGVLSLVSYGDVGNPSSLQYRPQNYPLAIIRPYSEKTEIIQNHLPCLCCKSTALVE